MKSLVAGAAVALALIGAAPRDASAQESTSNMGAVAATVVGAAVGGLVGYYYFTGIPATVLGVVAGGAVGDWWYMTAAGRDSMMPSGKMKMRYADAPQPLQLIGYAGQDRTGLHIAAFSAAAD